MSELKKTLLEKHEGQQVGGDILCPHPVTGKMICAARPDGEGGFSATDEWKQGQKDAKNAEKHNADIEKLADEALAAEVEEAKNKKAAKAVEKPAAAAKK